MLKGNPIIKKLGYKRKNLKRLIKEINRTKIIDKHYKFDAQGLKFRYLDRIAFTGDIGYWTGYINKTSGNRKTVKKYGVVKIPIEYYRNDSGKRVTRYWETTANLFHIMCKKGRIIKRKSGLNASHNRYLTEKINNGEIVLEKAKENRYELILTEVHLSDGSGDKVDKTYDGTHWNQLIKADVAGKAIIRRYKYRKKDLGKLFPNMIRKYSRRYINIITNLNYIRQETNKRGNYYHPWYHIKIAVLNCLAKDYSIKSIEELIDNLGISEFQKEYGGKLSKKASKIKVKYSYSSPRRKINKKVKAKIRDMVIEGHTYTYIGKKLKLHRTSVGKHGRKYRDK